MEVSQPRKLDAEGVFFLMLIRSHWDSVTSKAAVERLIDSRLVNEYFESRGMKLPSSHTMLDHLNGIRPETRKYIFDRLLKRITEEKWDDMKTVGVGRFSVSANTDWLMDSWIMKGLLKRAYH